MCLPVCLKFVINALVISSGPSKYLGCLDEGLSSSSPAAARINDLDFYKRMIYVLRNRAVLLLALCLLLASSITCSAAPAQASSSVIRSSPRNLNLAVKQTYVIFVTGELHGGGSGAATFEWPGAGKMTSKQQLHTAPQLLLTLTAPTRHGDPHQTNYSLF
jgi:hypothetical protein